MKRFYVVVKGRMPGIYNAWDACNAQIRGFSGAIFKGFENLETALAYARSYEMNDPQRFFSPQPQQQQPPIQSTQHALTSLSLDPRVTQQEQSSGQRTVIYADGSCINVGCPDARAGSGVYFGPDDPRNSSFAVPGDQTNNRGEIWAIIKALELTRGPVEIRSDSQLAMKCASKEWKAKQNLDLFQYLWQIMKGRDIQFTWVKGHSSEPGNEAADKLALDGSYLPRLQ